MNDLQNIDEGLPVLDLGALPCLNPVDATTSRAARRHARRVGAKRFARLEQNKAAADHIGQLPPRGTALHLAMNGTYSGWSLLEGVLELAKPARVDEIFVSTLGISRQNVDALFAMLDEGRISRATVCISHYFRHSDRWIFADLQSGLADRGQRCHILRNHAKLILFTLDDGRRLCLEGSFNCRSSMNHEQALLVDDPDLFEFHHSWIHDLIETTETSK